MQTHLDRPRVSLCLPAFNYEAYVAAALRSLMAQHYPNLEILVLDNGSTDATGAICHEVAAGDGRVQVRHQEHTGVAGSHNALLHWASGDFIAIASADDIFYPEKTAQQVAYLQANPQIDAAFTLVEFINGADEKIAGFGQTFTRPLTPQQIAQGLLHSNVVCMPSNLIRRSIIERIGDFDTSLQHVIDYDYWLRILEVGQLGVVPEKLMAYRIHAKNTALRNGHVVDREAWRIVAQRVPSVLKVRPELHFDARKHFAELTLRAMNTGDWKDAESFLVKQVAHAGMHIEDALRLTYCYLRQDETMKARTLLHHVLAGKVRLATAPAAGSVA